MKPDTAEAGDVVGWDVGWASQQSWRCWFQRAGFAQQQQLPLQPLWPSAQPLEPLWTFLPLQVRVPLRLLLRPWPKALVHARHRQVVLPVLLLIPNPWPEALVLVAPVRVLLWCLAWPR